MHRRALLKIAAMGGIAASPVSRLRALSLESPSANPAVRTVLLVTMCHLDVGFSMTQEKVIREYFDVYYPAAIKISAEMRKSGHDRYMWTTGSWLLYEYLEQASSEQRKTMEAAITAGDIDWHALPFNWQTEMIDRSMIEGSLGFSKALDARFDHKTIGAKMTDVPGHSRGIVAPLHAAGVRLLDIGPNPAPQMPDVPDVFLWKEPDGRSLVMIYHHDYGGILKIPGSEIAVDVEVKNDNSGPHTPAEIAEIYIELRRRFPNAQIIASGMSDVAVAVDQVRDHLPIVTAEIGDTWIYGCASDPYKVSRYREVSRLRKSWIAQGTFASGDITDRNLLGRLLLAPEHTWGTDTKTYLGYRHYRPAQLDEVQNESRYKVMELSWKEKRDDIDKGVESLPSHLRERAIASLDSLQAKRPSTEGMLSWKPSRSIDTEQFTLAFNPENGAIIRLRNRTTGREWATPDHPIGLFTYQTLSSEDYVEFRKKYITIKANWVPLDNGKPDIDKFGAASVDWHPRLIACWTAKDSDGDRIVLELSIDDEIALATGNVAWPKQIFLEMHLSNRRPKISLKVVTLGKVSNRLPEAMWLTFAPAHTHPQGWTLEKVDQPVNPLDVARGGGRSMHAVSGVVRHEDNERNRLVVNTLDAPVVAVGARTPLNFSLDLPNISDGIHFNLYNNAWGTNYPQWCSGDWLFRFDITA